MSGSRSKGPSSSRASCSDEPREASSRSPSAGAAWCWRSGAASSRRRWPRFRNLSIDAVPDVTNTQVAILTSAPGLSPLEVEQYLTFPVEMAMNGVPGLDEIRSISRTAVSAVTVIFKDGTEPGSPARWSASGSRSRRPTSRPATATPSSAPSRPASARSTSSIWSRRSTRRWSCARCSTGTCRSSCARSPASSRSTAWGARPSSTRWCSIPSAWPATGCRWVTCRASSSATTPPSAAATSRRTGSRSPSAPTPSSTASRRSRTPW